MDVNVVADLKNHPGWCNLKNRVNCYSIINPNCSSFALAMVIEWVDKREVLDFRTICTAHCFCLGNENENSFQNMILHSFNSQDYQMNDDFWKFYKIFKVYHNTIKFFSSTREGENSPD